MSVSKKLHAVLSGGALTGTLLLRAVQDSTGQVILDCTYSVTLEKTK
jgi:hypothetical protein